jgi:hypothetical protein
MPSHTRRRFLRTASLAVAGVAGCAGDDAADSASPPSTRSPAEARTRTPTVTPTPTATAASGGPAPHLGDFVLWNDDDTPHRLSLTVERDGAHLRTITRRLDPGASIRVPNPIDRQGRYRITAALETPRRRRIEWRIDSCTDAEYLQCFVDGDGTLGLRVLRRTVDPAPECG